MYFVLQPLGISGSKLMFLSQSNAWVWLSEGSRMSQRIGRSRQLVLRAGGSPDRDDVVVPLVAVVRLDGVGVRDGGAGCLGAVVGSRSRY